MDPVRANRTDSARELNLLGLRGDLVRPQIADDALAAGIAPRPAQTVVEHRKRIAGGQVAEGFGFLRRTGSQSRSPGHPPIKRLGVMGSDNAVGQIAVGEVAAIGVIPRVGRVRRSGKREALSADGRRPRR